MENNFKKDNFKKDNFNTSDIDIIRANVKKILMIQEKIVVQNANLKSTVSKTTEPIINDIRQGNEKLKQEIKENSGLLNSIRRLFVEIKECLSRPAEQLKTQDNLALSGNSMKSMNNQLVEIAIRNRDKNLESAEEFGDSLLNKVNYEKQDVIVVENKDDSDKISR